MNEVNDASGVAAGVANDCNTELKICVVLHYCALRVYGILHLG